jgi:hypothetical protein
LRRYITDPFFEWFLWCSQNQVHIGVARLLFARLRTKKPASSWQQRRAVLPAETATPLHRLQPAVTLSADPKTMGWRRGWDDDHVGYRCLTVRDMGWSLVWRAGRGLVGEKSLTETSQQVVGRERENKPTVSPPPQYSDKSDWVMAYRHTDDPGCF